MSISAATPGSPQLLVALDGVTRQTPAAAGRLRAEGPS